MLPAEEVTASSFRHFNHCPSHLVKLARKSQNVVQKEVRHRNNFETRFLHELFFQIRREPRQQSATETDGIFLQLVDKAGAHNSPRSDQTICCRDQNLPSRDARSANSDGGSIASQGSPRSTS